MTPELEKRLEHCFSLPTPPNIATKLLNLSEQPDVELEDLRDVIRCDTALTAKMLRAANSPIYGYKREATTLIDAIMFLGVDGAVSLALTFTLAVPLKEASKISSEYSHLWKRSALSALVASELAKQMRIQRTEQVFLAAILQDIGMFALMQVESERYPALLEEVETHAELPACERELFGASHAEIGRWLLDRWNVPESISNVVGMSDAPLECISSGESKVTLCVAISWRLTEYLMCNEPAEVLCDQTIQALGGMIGLNYEDQLFDLLQSVQEKVPQLNQLVQSDILNMSARESMISRAKELLLVRQIRMMGEIEVLKNRVDRFEARAKTLRDLADKDDLTGLHTRTAFDHRLVEAYERSRAQKTPLSVVMIDIDNFREINEEFGHIAGDQGLRHVAKVIEANIGIGDSAARYGGDEFIIIFQDCDRDSAKKRSEQIRKEIDKSRIRACRSHFHASVSIGVATLADGGRVDTIWDLVSVADDALYDAKRNGKNRTRVAKAIR